MVDATLSWPAAAGPGITSPLGPAWAWTLCTATALLFALLALYTLRHYLFSLNRLFGTQRHPYAAIVDADWPRVTVLVAAHNEEAVIADYLAEAERQFFNMEGWAYTPQDGRRVTDDDLEQG